MIFSVHACNLAHHQVEGSTAALYITTITFRNREVNFTNMTSQ